MSENQKKKPFKSIVIVLLIIAVLAFGTYPIYGYYLNPLPHTHFHAVLTVNGEPYVPKKSDISGASFCSINDDGSIDCTIYKGTYGGRAVSVRIDGMETPLVLQVTAYSCNATIKSDIHVDVDTETKEAHFTGTASANEEPKHILFSGIKWSDYLIDKVISMNPYNRPESFVSTI